MPTYKLMGLVFTQPVELVIIIAQILCYLNQYYTVIFLLGPHPFLIIIIITFINSRAISAFLSSNSTHKAATALNENSQFCKKCKDWVSGRDHHCVFTGRCVQKSNYRYFVSYLFYSYILSCFLVGTVLSNYQILLNLRQLELKHSIPLVFGLISGIYFLIFTGGLLSSSFRSIILGIYTVDEIKKKKTPTLSNNQIRKMWFSRAGRTKLWSAFLQNWKWMVGEKIGWKQILFVL